MSVFDEPRHVRSGEELPVAELDAYLKGLGLGLEGQLEIAQYPGGASNLTYLLTYSDRQLVLRRPPFGHKAKGAHDMLREARLMAQLKPVYRYVPSVLAVCEDVSLLGSEFYVMERLVGVIPRKDLPAGLVLDAAQTRTLCLEMIDRLIELHQVDYRAAGLSGLGKGEGYVGRQISGWVERYQRARTPDVPDFAGVMDWLKAHMPARDVATRLIHNDYRFDNVVLTAPESGPAALPMRVIGVLDWEMATIGDPLMDLGSTLAYWVQANDPQWRKDARLQPTHLPGMLTRDEVIAYYSERTGFRSDNFGFYEVYGLFRLAGILQQIYYRYYHQQTDNPAFAGFGARVSELHQECLRLIAG